MHFMMRLHWKHSNDTVWFMPHMMVKCLCEFISYWAPEKIRGSTLLVWELETSYLVQVCKNIRQDYSFFHFVHYALQFTILSKPKEKCIEIRIRKPECTSQAYKSPWETLFLMHVKWNVMWIGNQHAKLIPLMYCECMELSSTFCGW